MALWILSSTTYMSSILKACPLMFLVISMYFLQASRLIVTFDEHVISNNFKFGVIYQKFGQVSDKARLCRRAPFVFIPRTTSMYKENVISDFLKEADYAQSSSVLIMPFSAVQSLWLSSTLPLIFWGNHSPLVYCEAEELLNALLRALVPLNERPQCVEICTVDPLKPAVV